MTKPSAIDNCLRAGDAQGGGSPLVGGAAARSVTTGLVGARRVAAWGEPARPGLPPEGETEKGAIRVFLVAAAASQDSFSGVAAMALVRQLRGPHLSTCPWWSMRSSMEPTEATSPNSLPQSSTGRLEVSKVLARS